jgi:predicted O-methyltransferase YrrM
MSQFLRRLEGCCRWTYRTVLDAWFWKKSCAEFRALLQAHPGQSTDEVLALTNEYRGWGWYRNLVPMQVASELRQLIDLARTAQPRIVLEIGTHKGGTLLAWTRMAREMVISVDLPGTIYGAGYPLPRARLYQEFKGDRPDVELVLFRGDSQADATKEIIRGRLRGRPVDILFIDGDHSLPGVTRDYNLWKDLVRPGGYILFHDICVHPQADSSSVDQFWAKLRKAAECFEFIANPQQGWAGIGGLQVPPGGAIDML